MPADSGSENRDFLRHIVATLSYRAGKGLRDVPAGFGAFRAGPTSRTASEILAHMGDLLDWALSLVKGTEAWHDSPPVAWDQDVARFYNGLGRLDAFLASDKPLGCSAERLFQGALADSLTHVGQLALLRRLAGGPIRGENYSKADIVAGRVGPDQPAAKREFD